MQQPIHIHLFAKDLRLADNPALSVAAQQNIPILPIYIMDEFAAQSVGNAEGVWVHHSLRNLHQSLKGNLSFYAGNMMDVFTHLMAQYKIASVSWSEHFEPQLRQRDDALMAMLHHKGIDVYIRNGSLLWHPASIMNKTGNFYNIFTPYYKYGCLAAPFPRMPLSTAVMQLICDDTAHSLDDILPLPSHIWHHLVPKHWDIGEIAAQKRLKDFLQEDILSYHKNRDIPASNGVSHLSPYLHFGEISPNQIWYAALDENAEDSNIQSFCRQLAWREFSYYMLYHKPYIMHQNLRANFDNFPWEDNPSALKAWQQGKTGIPFVDAAMRELYQTGYMHNRLRMIAASFLVKNLLIHWKYGRDWFEHCLVDADMACNNAGWQWVAGTGIDAAPYFRIFNPILQGQKFDPKGEYIRRFVPELEHLPNKYLFAPWEAPKEILAKANIILGEHYPKPIIDLKESRIRALQAYQMGSS